MKRLLAALCGIALLASAQPAASEGRAGSPVTWDDVLRAVDRHPLVGMGRGLEAGAEGGAAASRELPNPELALEGGESRALAGDESGITYAVELVFPVEWISLRRHRLEAAQAGAGEAQAESAALRNEAVYELRTIFIAIARDHQLLERLRPLLDDYLRLVQMTKRRVDRGEARPSELGRLEAEARKFQIDLREIESRERTARAELNEWMGGALPPDFRVEFDLSSLPEPPALDQALARAEAANPSITAGRSGLARARAELEREKTAAAPSLALGGAFARELDATNASVVAVIGLPLFNTNRGAVASARGQAQAAEAELEYIRSVIRNEAARAHAEAVHAREAALVYREDILPLLERNAGDAEKMYRLGETSLFEVIDARRSLNQAGREYIDLLGEFHLAMARLAFYLGESPK